MPLGIYVISCCLQNLNIVHHYSQLPLYDGNYLLATHHYSLPSCLRKRSLFSVFRPDCPPCAPSYHSTGSWDFLSKLIYSPFILFQFLLSKLFSVINTYLFPSHVLFYFFFIVCSYYVLVILPSGCDWEHMFNKIVCRHIHSLWSPPKLTDARHFGN